MTLDYSSFIKGVLTGLKLSRVPIPREPLAPSREYIITEDGDRVVTEQGDYLITEER